MKLLDKAEAAAEARTTPSTLDRLRKAGAGPEYVQLGGRIFYPENAVGDWIKRRTVQPTAQKILA